MNTEEFKRQRATTIKLGHEIVHLWVLTKKKMAAARQPVHPAWDVQFRKLELALRADNFDEVARLILATDELFKQAGITPGMLDSINKQERGVK